MIFLGILVGFIFGLSIGFFLWYKKKQKKFTKRGLLDKEFTITDNKTFNKHTIKCQYEIEEIESTDTLTKVRVIQMSPSNSEWNSANNKNRLKEMIDGSWIETNDIKWITTAADVRNRKIDEILN
jgi:hypothetical protein